MAGTHKTISNSARFITYLNHVFFYTRFIFIYIFSALLEIMGLSALASTVLTVCMVALTVVIVSFIVQREKDDYSKALYEKLKPEYILKSDEKTTPAYMLYLYLGVEYLFDISWMFGFSRQLILTCCARSHAIALLASYQAFILIGAAYLATWLAYIKYTSQATRVAYHNQIFFRLNIDDLSDVIKSQDTEPFQYRYLYSCIALGISFLLFAAFQYFLAGSFVITQCYSISYYLLSFLCAFSLSYVFLGHKENYWHCLWVGFISISATLGLIFFGKIVFMALLGHTVSDFYYSKGVGIFFGCAIAIGFIYSHILEHFSVNNRNVNRIYEHFQSPEIAGDISQYYRKHQPEQMPEAQRRNQFSSSSS